MSGSCSGFRAGWPDIVPAAIALTITLGACADLRQGDQPPSSRGFIMISLDTVSAEHLSLYGYDRATTPFLDSLAAEATVFDRAFVQLPGTLPSHMSMFTGLYPDQHNVFPPDAVLSPNIPTLPELFLKGGFRTGGFTEGGFVSGRFGFSRGFETFSDERILIWTGGDHVFKKGLRYLEGIGPDERFFLFLHTYAAHDPYTPPDECKSLFWEGPPPEGVRLSESRVLTDHNSGTTLVSSEEAEFYRSQYDAEIRCLDQELERFFVGLQMLGIRDQITVIITSDHGEEFLEHGKMAHDQIFNENLHVPLIVALPGQEFGRRVEQIVQSIDLLPTLLELADLPAANRLPGTSLTPLLQGNSSANVGEAFSRSFRGDRSIFSLEPEGLFHLVKIWPNREKNVGKTVSVARTTECWVAPGLLELDVKSSLEPIELLVEIDNEEALLVKVGVDNWQHLRIAIPDDGSSHLLRLRTDTCAPTARAIEEGSDRCLSFLVKGLPDPRTELFHTDFDRAEQRELSAGLLDVADGLSTRLEDYRFEPVAEVSTQALAPELEEQLRALGYLESKTEKPDLDD